MTEVADDPARTRACRACRQPLEVTSRFCGHCGAVVESRADRTARRDEYRAQWIAVKRVIVFYVCYVCTLLPLVWSERSTGTIEALVVGLDALLIAGYALITRTRILPWMRLNPLALYYTAVGLLVLPVCLGVNFLYHGFLGDVLEIDTVSLVAPYEDNDLPPWVAIVFVCLTPAVLEELAFRGLIQSQLRRALGSREAIFLCAMLFAIIHVSVFSGIYLFALGLVLGVLRHRSRSLLPGIVLHFFHNFAVLVVEYYTLWNSPGNT